MNTENLVSIKSVKQAIVKLQSQGENPSNRNIRRVLGGGSPNSIQSIISQIEEVENAGVSVLTILPDSLQSSLLGGVNSIVLQATTNLQHQVEKLNAEKSEVLNELEGGLHENENLGVRFESLSDDYRIEQQRCSDLKKQVGKLEVERQQLIEAGEKARTGAAKYQLQVERADQAAEKADAQVNKLQGLIEELKEQKAEALQRSAVAEQQSNNLIEQNRDFREFSCKVQDQIDQLKEQKAEAVKCSAVAEQQSGDLKEQIRSLQNISNKTEGILISQIQDLKAELARFQWPADGLAEAVD